MCVLPANPLSITPFALASLVRSADTVFEYWVDPKQRQWMSWESKLASTYRPPPDTPFFKILVRGSGV